MAEILVVEDNDSIREGLRILLESECHDVRVAADGNKGVAEFTRRKPQCVILDVSMPRKSGFDVCREIRAVDPAVPILFLSARKDETSKVLGLGLGADDYLTKPFGTNELVARVGALLRRCDCPQTVLGERFGFGNGMVDARTRVFVNRLGRRVAISRHELELMQVFVRHKDEVLSRRHLICTIWGEGYVAGSRSLDTRICCLRGKIRGCGWTIDAVIGEGYRLATGKRSVL